VGWYLAGGHGTGWVCVPGVMNQVSVVPGVMNQVSVVPAWLRAMVLTGCGTCYDAPGVGVVPGERCSRMEWYLVGVVL
jgi:hypothetical protein